MTIETTRTFLVHNKTPVGFGKLKGKPHSDFLLPSNARYRQWVIDQGSEFRYKDTRNYILKARSGMVRELTPSEWELLSVVERDLTEDEHFNNFLLKH